MCDHNRCPVLAEDLKRPLDGGFRLVVDARGRFIEYEDRGILQNGSGHGDSLSLSSRELLASFSDNGFVAIRQHCYEIMRFCLTGGFDDLFISAQGDATCLGHAHQSFA